MTRTSEPVMPTGYDWTERAVAESSPPRLDYRWFAKVAAAIVFASAMVGLVVGILIPENHAARAEILYPITEELPTGFLREDRNLTTQLVLIRSRAVLAPAAEAEGMPLQRLESQITVDLLDSSEIIQVEVRDRSPDRAMRLVDNITETYLALAQTTPESSAMRYVESELADVEAALAQARRLLGELREQQAAGAQLSDQIDAAVDEVSDLRARAAALRSERDQIEIIERAAPTAELITQPYVLETPVTPRPVVLGAAGGLAGIVIAACVVALLLRRRVRG